MLSPQQAVRLDRTVGRFVYQFHRALYRLTDGRLGARLEHYTFLLVTTTGRRSGLLRTTPLMTFPDGDRYVVVASNGGRDRAPDWFLNLSADPRVVVQVGNREFTALAQVLSEDERAEVWPRLVEYYRGWSHYETLTARRIPVVALVSARHPASVPGQYPAGQGTA
jgi:F420H(2)-dependent quinone reductase